MADGRSGPALVALARAASRVERALNEETRALRDRTEADMGDLNRRKSEGLLELSRIGRSLDRAQLDEATLVVLRNLRGALAENREVLALHLAAMEELGREMTAAISDEASDGTYSRPESRMP